MLSKVVDIYNKQLCGLVTGEQLYGIAELMIRKQGSETEQLPVVLSDDGEGKYVGIDDVAPLIIYHRVLNVTPTRVPNSGKGDSRGDLLNTYQMALFMYWDRKPYPVKPEELHMVVQARTPDRIEGIPDIKQLLFNPASVNLNTLQVYNQEYGGDSFKLPANRYIIQINYSIALTFNPACIATCP